MNRYQYIQRMSEPSTYAGIGILLALAGVQLETSQLSAITQAGAAISSLFAVFMPEKKQ
jgi:hypothetical protein